MTTTDLSQFGNRELGMAGELLTAYSNRQTTKLADDYFYDSEITVMMNKNSGNVFLTNSDCQVLMMNGDDLDLFIVTPYNGNEGFMDELIEEYEDLHQEDKEYLLGMMSIEQAKQVNAAEEVTE